MFTSNVLTIMFKGRKPSRTIKLNIRGGEKLPCPLGVLRGPKDTGACTQIKNISNTATFDYISIFSHPYFCFAFLFPATEHMFPALGSRLPTARSKEPAQNNSSRCWPHLPLPIAGPGGANLCLLLSCCTSKVWQQRGSTFTSSLKPHATCGRGGR